MDADVMEEKQLKRRRAVIVSLLGGIGSVLTAGILWPLWRFLNPPGTTGEEATVSIPREQVGVGQAHFFQYQGHAAVVVQNAPGEFTALSAVCTHLSCIVQWQPDKKDFLCPCHAGRFTATGKVISGPPPRPLPSYPVTVSEDVIVVG